ncbi:MAG: DUF4038 domain-containing protein [Muribaculaceae bacterium]|nr:DUF4038 domain-containing protein [Muribaculaceae bacterium]
MEQFKMQELTWQGKEPAGSQAQIDLSVTFRKDDICVSVKGFYAGNNTYKARFLPESPGTWQYEAKGCISDAGQIEVRPATERHGLVKAEECHFCYQDGTLFYPFGTTVYALIHQDDALMEETMQSLQNAAFNKVRFCVFPKHYDYNHNEPPFYAFEKDGEGKWDVNRPCYPFWERLDTIVMRMEEMGIQADLILFHPYDCWGFSKLSREENKVYLDYLLRRLSAMPNVWWSLANEYDLNLERTLEEWEELEEYIAENDSYGHLLSNHNCCAFWDFSRPAVTHACIQTKMLTRIAEWRKKYQKPIVIDECCYEGNLYYPWGSISGREMTNRFWRVVTTGGYCTHGETFLDENEILWWAKGGTLKGESPRRIAFLRSIVEELPGPIEPMDNPLYMLLEAASAAENLDDILKYLPEIAIPFFKASLRLGEELREYQQSEFVYKGHCKDDAFLIFYDLRTCALDTLELPESGNYRVELIDTWEMKRTLLCENVCGKTEITLPGKEGMAVLATRLS